MEASKDTHIVHYELEADQRRDGFALSDEFVAEFVLKTCPQSVEDVFVNLAHA